MLLEENGITIRCYSVATRQHEHKESPSKTSELGKPPPHYWKLFKKLRTQYPLQPMYNDMSQNANMANSK